MKTKFEEPFAHPIQVLAERRHVDVVVDGDRHAELAAHQALERDVGPAAQVRGLDHDAALDVGHPGRADADAHQRAVGRRAGQQPAACLADARHDPRRGWRAGRLLDPGQHPAVQVAKRVADHRGPEVDADDAAAVGGEAEQGGAAASGRHVPADLAQQALAGDEVVDEGRDGGRAEPRALREVGPGDRAVAADRVEDADRVQAAHGRQADLLDRPEMVVLEIERRVAV